MLPLLWASWGEEITVAGAFPCSVPAASSAANVTVELAALAVNALPPLWASWNVGLTVSAAFTCTALAVSPAASVSVRLEVMAVGRTLPPLWALWGGVLQEWQILPILPYTSRGLHWQQHSSSAPAVSHAGEDAAPTASPAADSTAPTANLGCCGTGSRWCTPVSGSIIVNGTPRHKGALGHIFHVQFMTWLEQTTKLLHIFCGITS